MSIKSPRCVPGLDVKMNQMSWPIVAGARLLWWGIHCAFFVALYLFLLSNIVGRGTYVICWILDEPGGDSFWTNLLILTSSKENCQCWKDCWPRSSWKFWSRLLIKVLCLLLLLPTTYFMLVFRKSVWFTVFDFFY